MPTAAAYALDRALPDPSCKRCHIWRRTTRGTAHGSVPRTLTQHHILSDVSFLSRGSPSRSLSLLAVDLDLALGTDSAPFLTVTTSTMTSTLTTPATTQTSTDIPSSTSPSSTVSDTSSGLTSTYISSLTSTNTLSSPVTPSSSNTITSSDSSSSSSSLTSYTSTTSVPETSTTAPTTLSSSTSISSMTPRSLSTTRTSTSVETSTSASDTSTTSSYVVSSTSVISTSSGTTSSVGSSTISSSSSDSTSSSPLSSSSTTLSASSTSSAPHSSTSTTLTNTSSGVISGSSSVAPSTTFATSSSSFPSSSPSASSTSTSSSSASISASQSSSSFSTSSLSSTISTVPSITFSSSFSASTTSALSSTPFSTSSSTRSATSPSPSPSPSSSPRSAATPTTTSTSTSPAALQYTTQTTTVTPNLYTSTITRTYVFTTTLPGDSTSSFTRVSTVITSGTLAPSAPASGPSLHKNSVVGIVVGGVLAIALVALWMLFIVRRHHRRQADQAHQQGQHLSAQSFGNLGPGSAAALGLGTWQRRRPLEDDDDDDEVDDEEKRVMGSERGRGGSVSPPGQGQQVQGHQQQQQMMMMMMPNQAYDGLLTAMGLPSSASSSSGHGYDAASSSGHGAPPGTISSSEVGLLSSNNGRRPSWGAIPAGSSATTTSRQYAFGQAAADLSPDEGVSGAGTPPLFPRSSGEGEEGVIPLASSEDANRLSHISRDSEGMKPGAWLSGKEAGEVIDEFGVDNGVTAPSTVTGTAHRSGGGTTSSSGHDDSDLPLSRGGKTATSTAPSSYNGRRPSVSSAPLAAFGTRSSDSSLGHGGGGERERDGRPIRSPSTLSAPIPALISPYSHYASSSAHGHQNGGGTGGRESSLGHDSSGHNSGSGSGSAHYSQGQGPLITIRRPSPPTAYTRTMRSSSPDNSARTSVNNTHGIRGLIGRIRSGSRASFSDVVSPADRKRGSNNGLPAVPPPSVSLGRSGSALVMSGPSSLLNPVNAAPMIPMPPPPPPPPPPGEGIVRQPPWAVHGQPLTLPPTPAESFVDDSMADGSGFGEGLLDPRLNMRFRIGTAIDSARQSAASLGDHVDYSRPFGGLVYNRLNSFTTVGSNTSRRTRETDADTSHAKTTES